MPIVSCRSKKAAKHEAAASALKSFVQFKDACEAQMTIRRKKFMNLDFTSDLTALDPQGKNKKEGIFLGHFGKNK